MADLRNGTWIPFWQAVCRKSRQEFRNEGAQDSDERSFHCHDRRSRKVVSEALKEHRDVDELLTQISRLKPTDKNFDQKIETLFENVDHHVEEEEGEIFQFVEENYSEEELNDIGEQQGNARKYSTGNWRPDDRQLAA